MSRRFLARAQASDVRECGCHVTASHASITAENYRKKQGRSHFSSIVFIGFVNTLDATGFFFFLSNCQHGLLYHRCFESGALEPRTFVKGSRSDSNSIKRDGSVLKVDMTKQFVSAV